MMLQCDSSTALSKVGRGNKVSAIKIVRSVSGLGLKEAKDLVETQNFDLDINENLLREPFPTIEILIARLREVGVEVKHGGGAADTTICMMEDALHEAVTMGTYEIAEDILALVKKWKK
jgi:hypothetical protein